MKKKWYKQKTTWTGVFALVGAAASVVTGEATVGQAMQVAVPSLLAIFLRQGIENR